MNEFVILLKGNLYRIPYKYPWLFKVMKHTIKEQKKIDKK